MLLSGCVCVRRVDTKYIKMFVLDEADEMLSRGFKDQIYDVFRTLDENIQVSEWVVTNRLLVFPKSTVADLSVSNGRQTGIEQCFKKSWVRRRMHL